MFVESNNFIYIANGNSHILQNLSLRKAVIMQVKHSFLINLRESFPIVVNPLLLVETKFAFTFGQECIKTINK